MCLDLRAVAHWFVAAVLGGAVMGGRGVRGIISRIWWVFTEFWGSFDGVRWAVREAVLGSVLSSLSFLGYGLTSVAASLLFGI